MSESEKMWEIKKIVFVFGVLFVLFGLFLFKIMPVLAGACVFEKSGEQSVCSTLGDEGTCSFYFSSDSPSYNSRGYTMNFYVDTIYSNCDEWRIGTNPTTVSSGICAFTKEGVQPECYDSESYQGSEIFDDSLCHTRFILSVAGDSYSSRGYWMNFCPTVQNCNQWFANPSQNCPGGSREAPEYHDPRDNVQAGTDNGISAPFSLPSAASLNQFPNTSIQILFGRAIQFASLGIMGTAALAMFIYAGLLWMFSGGNAELDKKALMIMLWTSIGLVVTLASYSILKFIFGAFG